MLLNNQNRKNAAGKDFWTQYQEGTLSRADYDCVRYATVNDDNDPNNINWNGFQFSRIDNTVDKIVKPFKNLVELRGDQFHLNLNYIAFTKKLSDATCKSWASSQNPPIPLTYDHLKPSDPTNLAEYAEFMLATSLHLRQKYNLSPDTWEVLLEPEHVWQWKVPISPGSSTYTSGPTIGYAILATAARLESNGFSAPRFGAPSNTDLSHAIFDFDQMAAKVPGALNYLGEFTYHLYGGVTPANRQIVQQRLAAYSTPSRKLQSAQLEKINADHHQLHSDLKIANASAWQQYALAGVESPQYPGAVYYIVDNSDQSKPPTLTLSPIGRYLRQYFRFIRPQALRIEAASDVSQLDPVAFINKNGTYVVVVKSVGASSFTVQGLPAGTYDIEYTTSTATGTKLPKVNILSGQALAASIPAAGVITIYIDAAGPFGDTKAPAAPTQLRTIP